LIGEQLLTLFESRRLLLPLERAFGQLFLLARQLCPDALYPFAKRLAPDLPVATKLGLMKLLLFEAGDGLATEKNLLLAARLLGLSLLAGHRQGNVTPLILGALGIQRRQGLFGLGQLGLGLTQASLQRPQFGT